MDGFGFMMVSKEDGKTYFLDYQAARDLLTRNYSENVCTYDEMLSVPNEYPCMFCTLIVYRK